MSSSFTPLSVRVYDQFGSPMRLLDPATTVTIEKADTGEEDHHVRFSNPVLLSGSAGDALHFQTHPGAAHIHTKGELKSFLSGVHQAEVRKTGHLTLPVSAAGGDHEVHFVHDVWHDLDHVHVPEGRLRHRAAIVRVVPMVRQVLVQDESISVYGTGFDRHDIERNEIASTAFTSCQVLSADSHVLKAQCVWAPELNYNSEHLPVEHHGVELDVINAGEEAVGCGDSVRVFSFSSSRANRDVCRISLSVLPSTPVRASRPSSTRTCPFLTSTLPPTTPRGSPSTWRTPETSPTGSSRPKPEPSSLRSRARAHRATRSSTGSASRKILSWR
jgi:hypothetical protein